MENQVSLVILVHQVSQAILVNLVSVDSLGQIQGHLGILDILELLGFQGILDTLELLGILELLVTVVIRAHQASVVIVDSLVLLDILENLDILELLGIQVKMEPSLLLQQHRHFLVVEVRHQI